MCYNNKMPSNHSNNNNGTNNPMIKFENVDLGVFLDTNDSTKNSKIHAIIAKIADNNPDVIDGVEMLMHESIAFPSFDRAIALLVTAKTERHLQAAEAALQMTINDIKTLHAKRSPYMTTKKTALYLFSLQYLITHLGKWKLQNGERNNFTPSLVQKLQDVKFKSSILGIPDDTISRECFTDMYRQPNHPVLRNFKFLDEQRLDSFANRLDEYERTRKSVDYPIAPKGFQPSQQELKQEQQKNVLKKIIHHLEDTFGIPKLDLDYLMLNLPMVSREIGKFINSNDQQKIEDITFKLMQHLEYQQLLAKSKPTERTL